MKLAGGPIHWFSKKQENVTLSATEAEYMAMTRGTKDVLWLRELLNEYGYPESGPTPFYVDNTGAVYLSRDPIVNAQTAARWCSNAFRTTGTEQTQDHHRDPSTSHRSTSRLPHQTPRQSCFTEGNRAWQE